MTRRNTFILLILTLTFPLFFSGSGSGTPGKEGSIQEIVRHQYEIVNIFPHDSNAFTQGLLYRDDHLFESTGRLGFSWLRKVHPNTGQVIRQLDLEDHYFGEGLTLRGEELVQITFQSGIGFVYDLNTFRLLRTFRYRGEGWGIEYDGSRFIMSDGTAELRFLDEETFEETGRLTVTENGETLRLLNELEIVEDKLFANVLFSDVIRVIDPETGVVTGHLDLSGLRKLEGGDPDNVLNGIAWNPETGHLFVTGKLWSKMFEIRLLTEESS